MKQENMNPTEILSLDFKLLKDTFSICRLDKDSTIPEWLENSDFFSLTRTPDELSIVCNQVLVRSDDNIIINKDWRIIKIKGPLDFSLTGIIAHISDILKKNNIPIFVISTYDTDYILVKKQNINKAVTALKSNRHKIVIEK
jgi:hypothetical protein